MCWEPGSWELAGNLVSQEPFSTSMNLESGFQDPARSLGPQEMAVSEMAWEPGFAGIPLEPGVMGTTCSHWK